MSTKRAEDATPECLYIGPYEYTVSFDGEASYDHDYLGVCLNRSRRIKLDPRQSDTELPQTLLHETLHAIGSVYGIDEWSRHKTDSDGKLTDKIDLMASSLLVFLRENKEVVEWLRGE